MTTLQTFPAPTVDEYQSQIVRQLLAQSNMSVNEAWEQIHRHSAVIARRYQQNACAKHVAGAIAYSARKQNS